MAHIMINKLAHSHVHQCMYATGMTASLKHTQAHCTWAGKGSSTLGSSGLFNICPLINVANKRIIYVYTDFINDSQRVQLNFPLDLAIGCLTYVIRIFICYDKAELIRKLTEYKNIRSAVG